MTALDDSVSAPDRHRSSVSVAGGDGDDKLTGGSAGDVLAGGAGRRHARRRRRRRRLLRRGRQRRDRGARRHRRADRVRRRRPTRSSTTSPTSSPSASAASTATATASASAVTATTRTRRSTPARPRSSSNGIDEDCNGRDDVNLDVDGDGFPVPLDCNDGNAAIQPGRARDPRQHASTRTATGAPSRFGLLRAARHQPAGRSAAHSRCCARWSCATRPRARGSSLQLRGSSCPFKKTQRARRSRATSRRSRFTRPSARASAARRRAR